jgi:hypothetical protein
MAEPNATTTPDVFPVPRSDLTPGDVVRTQMEALADNDLPYPDAGIETAYRFMAPDARQFIGSIRHFIDVVNNPIYQCCLRHDGVRYSDVRVRGRHALRALILTNANCGRETGFVFALERQQSPPHRHCWMTTSVRRVQV